MRKEFGKALREYFKKRLAQELPQFRVANGEEIPAGCALYSYTPVKDITFFVLLEIYPKEDWFNLSIAWSEDNKWPACLVSLKPKDPPRNGQMRSRLGELWRTEKKDRFWELVPRPQEVRDFIERALNPPPADEALAKIEPMVDEAIEHLAKEGMEYFRQVEAEHRGLPGTS